jgi:ADP-heptose:LPS heptosyltransferase
MTIPAVAALRRKYPRTHLSWLVEGSVGGLLRHQDFIDEVIEFPRSALQRSLRKGRLDALAGEGAGFLQRLREREYDVVLDFHGILKSSLISLCAKNSRRIGFGPRFAKEQSHLAYHERLEHGEKRLHKVDRNMLLARHLGANGSLPEVLLRVPEADEEYVEAFLAGHSFGRPLLALNPFSSPGSIYKRWPMERYGALAGRMAREMGATVLVLWGPGEEAEARMLSEMGGSGVVPACPTTVPQLLALLRRASAYVGGDTGVMHLAAFAQTPVLALFGPTDHLINGPYGQRNAVVRVELPCSPCKNKDCADRRCVTGITVERVFDELSSLLGRYGRN